MREYWWISIAGMTDIAAVFTEGERRRVFPASSTCEFELDEVILLERIPEYGGPLPAREDD